MNTEHIITGKNNPHVYPDLEIWGFPIALYLFLGGLAAGILFFTALQFVRTGGKVSNSMVKSSWLAPAALIIGLLALFADLHNKLYFWRLYTTISLESPMSCGAWKLLIITPLSMIWTMALMEKREYEGKFLGMISDLQRWSKRYIKVIALLLLVFSVILGVYTGILLSAFNARPLWNSEALAMLFLVSGLSTGVVLILWISRRKAEIHYYRKVDAFLILLELLLIVYFFMGLITGPNASVEAAQLFLGGSYTLPFWALVVGIGLIIPLSLEVLEMTGKKLPHYIVPALVLAGGLIFRIIMVHAGQVSSFTI